MRRSLVPVIAVALAACFGAAGAVTTVPTAAAQGAAGIERPTVAPITEGRAPSDDEAIAILRADVADFVRVDATSVRHATVGELEAVVGDDGLPIGYDDSLPVLLVTGVGVFRPSYTTTGETFSWGTMVIDATDGGLIGTFGQPGNPPAGAALS